MDEIPPVEPSLLDLDLIPAMTPPSGEEPNFEDPYSLAPVGRIVIGVTLSLVFVAVASRLYTRIWITRALGADDYLCVATTASVIAYCGVTLSVLGAPLGPHMWNVPLSAISPDYIQGSITVTNLYASTALLLKASLLVLYLRIFRTDKMANVLIWVGIVLIVMFYVVCITLTSVFCRASQWPSAINPIEFMMLQAESDCNKPQVRLAAGQGVFSTVSDVYVLLIPISLIWGLRLPLRRKVGICGIFLVGSMATGCSVATLYFRFVQRDSLDFTWDSAMNMILGAVELNVGIVCSCMPVSFIIFKRASMSSWSSVRQYWKTRRLRRSGSDTADGSYDTKPPGVPGNSADLHGELPKVPRATITGLRTFLGSNRTRHQTEMTGLSTYADLQSVDEEYHMQLKKTYAAESAPSQSQPHKSESGTALATTVRHTSTTQLV